MTQRQLTPDEETIVEEELSDWFVWDRANVAADLGLPEDERQWSEEDLQRVIDAIDTKHRQSIIDRFDPPTKA